jgi:hypothetical protein
MEEYTLVDCDTGLIYGPYECCAEAEAYAENYGLAAWEVLDGENKIVAWGRKPNVLDELKSFLRRSAA